MVPPVFLKYVLKLYITQKLNSRIIELETENKILIENQQNYNFLYTAPSDGMYKIQLKKGEILIIKEN